jgi:hypothetical protein
MDRPVFDFRDSHGLVEAHQHPTGGGWVANTATVAKTAFVGPEAQVYGKAQVFGHTWVSDEARIYGNTEVYGRAVVRGNARVFGEARVYGNARVSGKCEKTPVVILTSEFIVTITDNLVHVFSTHVEDRSLPPELACIIQSMAQLHQPKSSVPLKSAFSRLGEDFF